MSKSSTQPRQILTHLLVGREETACGRGKSNPAFCARDASRVTCPRCLASNKAKFSGTDPVERLRKAVFSAASFLQEIPAGGLPAEDTLEFIESDVRAALSALEEIQDFMPENES